MSVQKKIANTADLDAWSYRLGGVSAIVFGLAYMAIIVLYAPMGAPPSGVEAHLAYVAENTTRWWAILGLSVLTDFLLIPVALALYQALKEINRNAMRMAVAWIGLFVILDLALTWMNYAVLITLSGDFAAATNDAQKAAIVTAATYPSTVVQSNLLFVYNSLTLAIGILTTGAVMLKGIFNRSTAYLGLAAGMLGIVAVISSFFAGSVSGVMIILASVLTTIWVFFVGYRLYRLSQQ